MLPVLFTTDLLGFLDSPVTLHSFGVSIAAAFFGAVTLAARRAPFEGYTADVVVDVSLVALLGGLLGARVVFVATQWQDYVRRPIEALAFWRGGVVFYGGVAGALLFAVVYCRFRRLSTLELLDLMVPYVALGHAVGRVGCLGAGCCFGSPTTVPWAIHYPIGSPAQQEQQAAGLIELATPALPVHPTPLYEAGLELALFAALLMFRRRKSWNGQLLALWTVGYSVGRAGLEQVRGDAVRGVYAGLSTSQWLALLAVLGTLGVIYWRGGLRVNAEPLTEGVDTP